jgi:hypothetical protein
VSAELEFKIIDKVVDQGEKRLQSMFRETLADLESARDRDLTDQQQADLDQVIEAYQLARRLIITLVDVKDNIKLRMGH